MKQRKDIFIMTDKSASLVDQLMQQEIAKVLPFSVPIPPKHGPALGWAWAQLGNDGLVHSQHNNMAVRSFNRKSNWASLRGICYFRKEKDAIYFKMLCD